MCWINNIIGTQSVRFNSYVAGGLVGQNLGTIVFSEDGFTVKSTIKTPVANFNSTTVGGVAGSMQATTASIEFRASNGEIYTSYTHAEDVMAEKMTRGNLVGALTDGTISRKKVNNKLCNPTIYTNDTTMNKLLGSCNNGRTPFWDEGTTGTMQEWLDKRIQEWQ